MIKILIVDDVEANLYSLNALLSELKTEEYQFEILQALGGKEALQIAIQEQDIHLIILDVQMPDMDGFEVAKLLQSNSITKNIPIVFLTAAFKAEEFVQHGFELGAIDYFTKPIEKFQFLNKIRFYLDMTIKNFQLKELNNKLENLTQNLKEEVKKEVQANREKDKILLQQSRLAQMGEMLSMIAHQWRQPLTAISAASTTLILKSQLDKLDNDFVEEIAQKITQYTQHLSTTIDDFRDFFKPDKEKRETSYKELIDSVLNIVETSIKNRNIELKEKVENEITLYSYDNELKQVILNLIKNAEDILLEKKIQNPIIIIESDNYILKVRDNAGGVPENIIDKVFNPYFSTKSLNGTGLGLYMSKIIIEEHCGGSLRVYNDAEGAVFEIELPALKDEVEKNSENI